MKNFKIKYEISDIYCADVSSDLKIATHIFLILYPFTLSQNSKSRIFNNNYIFSDLKIEILLSKEDFNELTGLNWNGTKTDKEIEELKKKLLYKEFNIDLGIKSALQEEEKNGN